jgi:hypothetical protein
MPEENLAISKVEVVAHFASKKPPPKEVIPPKTVQHFVDMLEREPGHVEALKQTMTALLVSHIWKYSGREAGKQFSSSENRKNNRSPGSRCFLSGKKFPDSENRKNNRSPCSR